MVDLSKVQAKIPSFQNKSYSTSQIHKIISRLKKNLEKVDLAETEMEGYLSDVVELYCATSSLYPLQKTGCFKLGLLSKGIILEISNSLLSLKDNLGLTPFEIQFLRNVPCFMTVQQFIASETKVLHRLIKDATKICKLHGYQCTLNLTLCAFVQHMVIQKIEHDSVECSSQNLDDLDSYPIESVIAALGFTLSICDECIWLIGIRS